ncbi:MAG: redoxin domain-containing protein [Planctomycetaceae bacterium]|nr:redoxin domain-containing protein [Planctomycetaceae bacterium]
MSRYAAIVGIAATWLAYCALAGRPDCAQADDHGAAPPAQFPANDRPIGISATGELHRLECRGDVQGQVFVFLSPECPIACKYVPTLNELALRYRDRGIRFYGILADSTITRTRAIQFERDYRLEFPLLFDASLELASILKPTHTPEAFLLAADDGLRYRGRIDDRFESLGKQRSVVASHDLRRAIDAALEGRAPSPARTEPVGCRFEALSDRRANGKASPVTFARDVAPLVWNHCASCHREGEVAPFSLTSYSDCAKRAEQLAEVVRTRYMPPWKAEPGFNHFVAERRLTTRQLELFAAWAQGGALEGDPFDLPPLPKFADGWQLGTPDLIVEMPEPFEIPADGPDLLRWFVLPFKLPPGTDVVGFEFRPGNPRVVHHSIAFLDISGMSRQRDAADPGPGYTNFGGPGFPPAGYLGNWIPGGVPRKLPEGLSLLVPRGSVIALMMHYYPSGKPETDRSQIGLHLAPKAATGPVTTIPVTQTDIEIPPDAKDFRIAKSYVLPIDATALSATPHMHYPGREMRVTAKVPGQTDPIPLVWIKDWDFNWQGEYHFAAPIRLPKGTEILVEGYFDNTKTNPRNPYQELTTVRYGQESTDEMCLCGIQIALDDMQDFAPFAASLIKEHVKFKNGKLVIVPLDDSKREKER